MNILQILPELNVGGVETGVIDLSKYLVRCGHKSIVVSSGGVLVEELQNLGAKHYTLDVKTKSLFSVIRAIPELVEIIKSEDIDIVHARSRLPAWIGFFANRKAGRTFITTCHGYYSRHIFSRVMGWGKLIIVPSRIIGRHMIEDFNVPYDRIRKIERAVDLEKFKFNFPKDRPSKEYNIGLIGRITPIKGHPCFLQAIAKVTAILPNTKAHIIGSVQDGQEDYYHQLKRLISKLGIIPYVDFMGKTEDITSVLNNLDLLILPSIGQEAFGRVIIEAQAQGVSVIASRIGGIVDIIDDGITGMLFTPNDDTELANKIITLLKDKELRAKFILNARKKVEEKYNLESFGRKTLEVYNQAKSLLKILVIKISSLGDVILAVPSLRAIRKKFPQAIISLLVGEPFASIIARCPYINEVIVYDAKNKHKGLKGIFKIVSILKIKNFDKVIDLQNNKISHWLGFLSLVPKRYGYKKRLTSFLLNNTVTESNRLLSPVEHQFHTLSLLDIKLEDNHLELWPNKEDFDYIAKLLKAHWLIENQVLIGINLSASLKWQTKGWAIKKQAMLCEELEKKGYAVVIIGSLKDEVLVDEFKKELKAAKPIIAVGKTSLNQLAALIRRCDVLITGDSAPMHIAAAVNTAFVSLFGPTHPLRHLPPAKNFIVIRKELSCSPCYKPRCKSRICMEQIEVSEVMDAVDKLLNDQSPNPKFQINPNNQ